MIEQHLIGPKTFGEVVISLMSERYLTIREVAKAANISNDTVRRIRAMKSPTEVRPTTFRALAGALGLSVDELHNLTKDTASVVGSAA